MMGWILFETGKKNGGPQAWPAASTTIEAHNEGYRLVCGDAVELVDDIDFTLDFPAMMAFLHPGEGEEGEPQD